MFKLKKAAAWIFRITTDVSAAVGEFELVHLPVDRPVLVEVPQTPHFCRHVMVWQNKIVPVMNLVARFLAKSGQDPENRAEQGADEIIAIFAYRARQSAIVEYGALALNSIPWRIAVSDAQMCDLPTGLESWRPYVISCFQSDLVQGAVPVLNISRLFSDPCPVPA